MPQKFNDRKVFSLKEVAESVKRTLASRYGSRFWVKAEMNKLNNYDYSGHCYPDLIERADGRILAQMRGIIWAIDFRRINTDFFQATGENLSDGMQILFEASVSFDPNHGLSLIISNIDPSFTLGELEREKRKCIAQLQREGIWDNNHRLPMPFLPKRLAIISVSTSKGYADFISLLNTRSEGFNIQHMLFPAILQGEKAVEQIAAQLEKICKVHSHFDLVAIIRGGGGDTGLSAFNHYRLAGIVATFPLPVMTGIGHATNLTVTEMVAHTRAITPSELADILLERMEFLKDGVDRSAQVLKKTPEFIKGQRAELNRLSQQCASGAAMALTANRMQIAHTVQILKNNTRQQLLMREQKLTTISDTLRRLYPIAIERNALDLLHLQTRLSLGCGRMLGISFHKLDTLSRSIALLHPSRVLQHGYSITRLNGIALRDASGLQEGNVIETQLSSGKIQSSIIKTE